LQPICRDQDVTKTQVPDNTGCTGNYQLVHECVDIVILGEFGSAFPSICDASSFLVLLSVH